MGSRFSPLHGRTGLTSTVAVPPASRNGDTTNVVNGAGIDLTGKRVLGVELVAGVFTGAANVAVHLQVNDTEAADKNISNGNWTNINTTTYPEAAIAAQTDDNTAFTTWFDVSKLPLTGAYPFVRAVQTVDANAVVSGVNYITD